MNAVEIYQEIVQSAEQIDKSKPQRFSDAATDKDAFRLGDLYVVRRDKLLDALESVKKPSPQVAPGNTRGSRHILDSLKGVKLFQRKNATPLQGPWLQTTNERVLTHPEHGDVILPPGVYEILYQRAFAEELRRVQD